MRAITTDAFIGQRVSVERTLVCAMAGQFPVLARGPADELVVVCRSGAGHYGLPGTLATTWSSDGGRTWSDPRELAPRGHDVRNPALAVVGARWLVAYWQAGVRCYRDEQWVLPATTRGPDDTFVVTSDDRGQTWTAPRTVRSGLLAWLSPYGRIVALPDGTLLMAGYGPTLGGAPGRFDAVVLRSRDGGTTWGDEARVLADASELALCPLPDGTLLGAVRRAAGDVAIVRSTDGGATWSAPTAATRVDEHPADLCVLRGGSDVLLTFGRRQRPLGCGALRSRDGGATWDGAREVILAGDGVGNDVGYPSTVQLADGTLATALYFARGSGEPSWSDTSCQLLRYPPTLLTGAG